MRMLVTAGLGAVFIVALAGCGTKPAETENGKQPEPVVTRPIDNPEGPPETILFPSPAGNVLYTHRQHYERVDKDCQVCHPKVFPQKLAPLNYKKALHRAAEASMSSCAHCHAVGGTAFAADSNCTKCHAPREH